jgi:hypothetical protein
LLNPLSGLNDQTQIKDTKVSHLSCWILIVNDKNLADKLATFTRDDALPMHIRAKYQENEILLSEYSNLYVDELLDKLSQ